MGTETDNSKSYSPTDNSNTRSFLLDDKNCRSLDVFYTHYDTKLYVQDGELIEEKIQPCSPLIYSSSDDDLVFSHPSNSPPQSPPSAIADESIRQQFIDTAMAALEYYNNKYRTSYELVDPGSSNSFLGGGEVWFHCNFTAKPKTSGSSQKTFFYAEMKVGGSRHNKLLVTACRPLGAKRTNGCGMCCGTILHPTGRFRQGLYQIKPRVLRSRRSMGEFFEAVAKGRG